MKRFLSVALCFLLLSARAAQAQSKADHPPRVTIDSGTLQGSRSGSDVEMFLGIPYAAPPTGNLRWKPTVLAVKWSGVRQANSFGPICPQSEEAVRRINEQEKEYARLYPFSGIVHADEDCLTLNIWTTNMAKTPRLPVMVWIHGGGMNVGSGVTTRLGPRLARKGVVLVTLNFRLGLLGGMAHPALTLESPHHASGNYGTLDQIAALQWIQRNIAQFGGDPQNVTIFGGSSGASQVCYLMISPLAQGLFHHAIMQSGECRDTFLPELARRVDWDFSPGGIGGTAQDIGLRLAQYLNVPAGSDGLVQLRSRPWQEIVAASDKDSQMGGYEETMDGWVHPEQPAIAFRYGHQARVPVMLGSTEDESVLSRNYPATIATYKEALKTDRFFSHADNLFQEYPAKTDSDVERAYKDLQADDVAQGAYYFARIMTAAGQKAFLYYFTYPPKGKYAGYKAYHGLEQGFIAGGFLEGSWGEPDADDWKLVETMGSYWTQFAKTGDPNQVGLPAWPVYDPEREQCLEIGAEVKARAIPHLEKFAAFEQSLQARIAEYQKPASADK